MKSWEGYASDIPTPGAHSRRAGTCGLPNRSLATAAKGSEPKILLKNQFTHRYVYAQGERRNRLPGDSTSKRRLFSRTITRCGGKGPSWVLDIDVGGHWSNVVTVCSRTWRPEMTRWRDFASEICRIGSQSDRIAVQGFQVRARPSIGLRLTLPGRRKENSRMGVR
jgi:hypothetical protein